MARGDRLAVERQVAGSPVTYSHLGIDLGDGTVVHARPDDFRDPFGGGRVERTSVAAFALGRAIRIVTDPPSAFAPDEIATRALAHVGRAGYCPVVDNCEHFVTWCATGRRSSRQVELIAARARAAVGRVAAAVSARAAAAAASRVTVRTAAGTSVRLAATTIVPAAVVGEAVALVAEWRAHQRGASATESRLAGEAAGLAATAGACALAGVATGPIGIVGGALAGAALWMAGSAAAAVAAPVAVRQADRLTRG